MNTLFQQHSSQIHTLRSKLEPLNEQLAFSRGTVSALDDFLDQRETLDALCEKHGHYAQLRIWKEFKSRVSEKKSKCPCCLEEEISAVEEAIHQAVVTNLIDQAQVPLRFAHCTFENYQAENAGAKGNLNMLKDYVEQWPQMIDDGVSLILCGKPGTGKNHLAVALAKELIQRYQAKVLLTSVLRIIRAVRRSWGKDSEYSEEEVIDLYTSVDLLVIDEIGVQYSSNSEMITLFEIINARYEQKLPTVMISNLPVVEMSAAIGDRLVDRMAEGGGATLVFDWESYRSKNGVSAA